jgi:LPXTG-motif cell wall-anchored protein
MRYYFFFASSDNENTIAAKKTELAETYGISVDSIVDLKTGTDAENIMPVTDEKAFTLPKTGGVGTVGLTVTGVIFIMGSLCLIYIRFVAKKEGN